MDIIEVIDYIKSKISTSGIEGSIKGNPVRIDLDSGSEYESVLIEGNKVYVNYYGLSAEFNLEEIAKNLIDEYESVEEINKDWEKIESKYFVRE